jgi:hypothetical protein
MGARGTVRCHGDGSCGIEKTEKAGRTVPAVPQKWSHLVKKTVKKD